MSDPCHYNKVLIIRLSAIGDVLRTLPALNAWKRQCPDTSFSWLVEPAAASVLQGHPALDKVLVFERGLFRGSWRSPRRLFRGIWGLLKLIRALKSEKFDLVVDAHGIFKSGFFAWLSGCSERLGFARPDAKEFSSSFYSRHFKPSRRRLNRVDRALELVASLGVDTAGPPEYRLPLPKLPEISAEVPGLPPTMTAVAELAGRGPLIVIHPGSSPQTAYKRWHLDGYINLVKRLAAQLDARILLTWGPGERETVELIAGYSEVELVVARKTASLPELAAIFAECDLFVGGDTGPMHLAAAVGTPVVAIFGPTDPEVNAPRGVSWRLVRHSLYCSPCRKRSCRKKLCLEAIGPRQLLAAIEDLLAEIGDENLWYPKEKEAGYVCGK